MVGIAQNGKKCLIFIVVPQVRTKMREKGKRDKNKTKTGEWISQMKTHQYTSICMYIHIHGHAIIYTYRYTYA